MKVAEIFETMEYGPAPEAAGPAIAWLDAHERTFGHFIGGAFVPGHDHFMEYYAHAMAVFDPTLIVVGGFSTGTVGHEESVERFARVFRLLPSGEWESIPDLDRHVAGRALKLDGRRYLYLVNRSANALSVVLRDSVVPHRLRPLGSSPLLKQTDKGHEVALGPYELAAWTGD
jgi:hypothetical protein